MKIAFYSFEVKGIKRYEVRGFEKDKATGFWLHKYVSEFDAEKDNKVLASYMRSWRKRGEFVENFEPPIIFNSPPKDFIK